MNRPFLCLVILFSGCLTAHAQTSEDPKAYARVPREIAFQNDSQWEDNRWQQTDIGPFLAGSIQTPTGLTLKGLAIRVGDNGQAAVCYDTARCRMSAGWAGGFLRFDPRRFGVIRHPAADGKLILTTDRVAGWARREQFETDKGNKITRLPEDWITFHGHYTHNDRVVLSYSVGEVRVLESPWAVQSDSRDGTTAKDDAKDTAKDTAKNDESAHRGVGITRSLEVQPSNQRMHMWLADDAVATVIDSNGAVNITNNGRVLEIEPHEETLRVKVLLTIDQSSIERLRPLAGPAENLSEWIQTDSGRFQTVLTTEGQTTETSGPYVVDTLTLPFENPWKALMFTAGHDFFSDGTAAICTLHGDVWTVSGIDRDLKNLRWRRYATGLSQPLGLKIVDDRIYVINRTQLTRLEDRNGDGEADHYECFNNDNSTTPGSHDFVTCLETDPSGNFYYIHARTGVMRISADGKTSASVADGFRNPNGMGVSPTGMITAAPQQGQWTPQSSLIVVREGGYYGYGGPRTAPQRPTGWDLPMCFIPHTMDNSGGGQVWVESDRWGPLSGRMLHLSYGQCRLLLAVEESKPDAASEIDSFANTQERAVTAQDVIQGGTIEFPMRPGDFESGVMRGRFSPHDGQLYVSGLRGWQTRAIRDGCFQRVRYTGGAVHLPENVRTFQNGLLIQFTDDLDPDSATDPDNYFVAQWNYLWSSAYGSPEFSVARPGEQGRDDVPVISATLLPDRRTVFLETPRLHSVNQLVVDYALRSPQGSSFRSKYAHTINIDPTSVFPESKIARRRIAPLVSDEIVSRLEPGLAARITNLKSGESDVRILRLAASRDFVAASPSVFLPAGQFRSSVGGTIKIPLSGEYEFRLEGSGDAKLVISDEHILNLEEGSQKSESIRLRKGHNPLLINYESPASGIATWRLLWKGYNFDWEPVPPAMLFHDGGEADVQEATERRLGRQLVASHRCIQCHRTELGRDAMIETQLAAPDLGRATERLTRAWLEQWILDPASVHSNPSMPKLLAKNAKSDAADIAAFLAAMATASPRTNRDDAIRSDTSSNGANTVTINDSETGSALFESLACITCHHFDEIDATETSAERLSLYFASAKYREGAIADFLLDPDAQHVASRMPDFALDRRSAVKLEKYIRQEAKGVITAGANNGSFSNGITAVAKYGCQQCHALGSGAAMQTASRPWRLNSLDQGCLAIDNESRKSAPQFHWDPTERDAIKKFVANSLDSLGVSHLAESSNRLVKSLRCIACHDRDGIRSERPRIIAEEGSGRLPETIPSMTWLGEKFHADWNERLLRGDLSEKPRPWLRARMPAFPAYANALAAGLATEHAVDPKSKAELDDFDPEMAAIGEKLTLETGLDCRQCHAVGKIQPRGDSKTQIAFGINFMTIRERMRHESYHRFMLDPPRYDINTKMIKLSEDGVTTKLKSVYDQDARKQFEAVWHYMKSLQP